MLVLRRSGELRIVWIRRGCRKGILVRSWAPVDWRFGTAPWSVYMVQPNLLAHLPPRLSTRFKHCSFVVVPPIDTTARTAMANTVVIPRGLHYLRKIQLQTKRRPYLSTSPRTPLAGTIPPSSVTPLPAPWKLISREEITVANPRDSNDHHCHDDDVGFT